jgi:hypothetical protein
MQALMSVGVPLPSQTWTFSPAASAASAMIFCVEANWGVVDGLPGERGDVPDRRGRERVGVQRLVERGDVAAQR